MVEIPKQPQESEGSGHPLSKKEKARLFLAANHRQSPRDKVNLKRRTNPRGRKKT